MHELPLFIFTLAMQTAIGGVIGLTLYHYLMNKTINGQELFKYQKRTLITLAGLSVVGLAASFLHLGYPLNAINAIMNIAHSWMSREILCTALFIGVLLIVVFLAIKQGKVNLKLLMAVSVIGLITLFSMAALYNVTIFEQWQNANTYIGFYGSAAILGIMINGLICFPLLKSNAQAYAAVSFATTAVVMSSIIIQLVSIVAFGNMFGDSMLALLRWVCAGAAAGILAFTALKGQKVLKLIPIAFILLLVGELAGRYLFYSIAV